ncbi:MAG: carbonic anhydrase [Alphaproteobacteria bacterium]|nr:carbonic anhydrase [Alphaproteobacteria bacterium]MBV9694203.1 carbonic anhydrase [Alphaproteobacteria bacterium]
MAQLVAGYRSFRGGRWPRERERYAELAALGQRPRTLVIACSDSRSDPSTIFNSRPGELFVIRNIAAVVPPPEIDGAHHGTSAAIAFAVTVLNVSNILVMGHAQCSGVAAALDNTIGENVPFLRAWIDLLSPAVESTADDGAGRHASLERASVLLSMRRLISFPFVAERVRQGTLAINGARFGIADGNLEIYDETTKAFVAI